MAANRPDNIKVGGVDGRITTPAFTSEGCCDAGLFTTVSLLVTSETVLSARAPDLLPLSGATVLEFGTLVPGPLTSLLLAEAGADVIKIERPPGGDPLRAYEPKIDGSSVHFHALNRGKTSIFIDLKDGLDRQRIIPLLKRADIVIEQFRPGAMKRLGLDYATVKDVKPNVIYCSLTGWGQTGPKAGKASHDLNFLAESGHLDRVCGIDRAPSLPHLIAADIAGGVYPAVLNILLAYIRRLQTGEGAYLDVAIADGLMPFSYDLLIPALTMNIWPSRGNDLVTGGSPRYQLYRTKDARYLAVAAMEDRFWASFCDMIDLPLAYRSDSARPEDVRAEIQRRVAERPAAIWAELIVGKDMCCSLVATLQEALSDPQVVARQLLSKTVTTSAGPIPALTLPVSPLFRNPAAYTPAPSGCEKRHDLF